MKPFIIFLGLTIVISSLIAFQSDFGQVKILSWTAKADADKAAAAAVMMIDEEAYGDGRLEYNDWEILLYMREAISEKYQYNVYVVDEKGMLRIYENDINTKLSKLKGQEVLSFDANGEYTFIDSQGQENKLSQPCVSIILSLQGEQQFRNKELKEKDIVRSSMYVMEGRN